MWLTEELTNSKGLGHIKIWPGYGQDIANIIWLRYGQDMVKILPRYGQDIAKI